MMLSEFVERTGFEPTPAEYAKIEEAYCSFDGDKDAFCMAFVHGEGEKKIYQARAAEIDRLRGKILELDKTVQRSCAEYEKKLAVLQAQLDRELEWIPCDGAGTNMSQKQYEELAAVGTAMTDDEAKALIAEECGFTPEKITILHTACTYEVNKHRQMRKAAEYDRPPVYESTDWNYVRFDCASFMYELENGDLRFYNC